MEELQVHFVTMLLSTGELAAHVEAHVCFCYVFVRSAAVSDSSSTEEKKRSLTTVEDDMSLHDGRSRFE